MASHTLVARNWATESENQIHADDVAQRFGFRGGLVPGVGVFSYLVGPVVDDVGEDWLDGGYCDVRFRSPVYDGEEITAGCEDGDLCVFGPDGQNRVEGQAWASPAGYLDWRPKTAPVPQPRPPAGPDTLSIGTTLATLHHIADPDAVAAYLAAIGDDPDRWVAAGVVHPGWLLLDANDVLVRSVRLGPWIHTGSVVRTMQRVPFGAELETRAEVLAQYERSGHQWVVLDVLTLANGEPSMRTRHTAIWQLRQS